MLIKSSSPLLQRDAKLLLLEPITDIEIIGSETAMGDIAGDLTANVEQKPIKIQPRQRTASRPSSSQAKRPSR